MAQVTTKSSFVVDDMDVDIEGDDSNEEEEFFDSVCAFCDNGGDILSCEGKCMRSFHATLEAGEESLCESLGFTNREVEAMQSFFCKNCEYKVHQCFACGNLGSSDENSCAEVFQCANATCGYFYHPRCVAKLLHLGDEVAAEDLQGKIAAGVSFTCPIHKCCICKQVENEQVSDLQFAVCRRCPTSYHRRCLPREIGFEDSEDEDVVARAWENLLPNRILIYCLKHEIDDEIGIPVRDHIKFPFAEIGTPVRDHSSQEVGEVSNENLEPGASGSPLLYGTGYGINRAGIQDEMSMRYSNGSDEPYLHGIRRLSTGATLEDQLTGCPMDHKDSSDRGSIMTGLEMSDTWLQAGLFGQDPDPSVQLNYPVGLGRGYGKMESFSSIPRGHMGSTMESSYRMNMSATERYAPQLDELNHTMMSSLVLSHPYLS